jgi:RecG-like helicase
MFNASVMVVEHAERFGPLSIASIARTRWSRRRAGYCVLLATMETDGVARERLGIMEETNDGLRSPKRI